MKIDITVNTAYLPDQSDPQSQQFAFSYTIIIKNNGPLATKLLSRHWIITDANGEIQEVRGIGVVGEQPNIQPGANYEYTSGAVLNTPIGSMQGSYHMVTADGHFFTAEIAAFGLANPRVLN